MGIVRMGPPGELVLLMRRALNVSTFVETGTYKGDTATWAANHFENVITIQNSKALFDEVSSANRRLTNVEFVLGDSRMVLRNKLAEIHGSAIFWLDAHWCGMDSFGADDQCPIIEEIRAIRSTGIDHCILIDYARLFLSPPPLPNTAAQWPTVDLICRNLQAEGESQYIVVFEDVIVSVPIRVQSLVMEYCQAQSTKALREQVVGRAPNGFDLVGQGLSMIVRGARRRLGKLAASKNSPL
jgi:hypothetical protein